MNDIDKLEAALKLLDKDAKVWFDDEGWTDTCVFGQYEAYRTTKEAAKEWRHAIRHFFLQFDNQRTKSVLLVNQTGKVGTVVSKFEELL